MKKDIDIRIINLDNREFEWETPTFNSFVVQFPIFRMLKKKEIQLLLANIREVQFEAGEYLYQVEKNVTEVYVIIKGILVDDFYSYQNRNCKR